jgi:hypothetical protein
MIDPRLISNLLDRVVEVLGFLIRVVGYIVQDVTAATDGMLIGDP